MHNTDTDLVDFLDLANFTLADEFTAKWKYRFSVKFIREFQNKILKSLKERKPIKIESLVKHFTKKCGYSIDQVANFFQAIDINIYHPLIIGKFKYH